MDQVLKDSLAKLIAGTRQPLNGMEIHFLKVIKGTNLPCTPEEKEWFKWWQATKNLSNNPINTKDVSTRNFKSAQNVSHELIEARERFRSNRLHSNTVKLNPNLERIQKEKEAESNRQAEIGPRPEPIKPSLAELGKLKAKGPTSYTVDEGIAGSREDNKKMKARQWGEMVNRGKEK